METYHAYVDAFNAQVGKSTFGRIFRLDGCGHVCFIASIRALLSLADMPNRRMKSSTLGLLQRFELGSLHSSPWRTSSLSMLVCEGSHAKNVTERLGYHSLGHRRKLRMQRHSRPFVLKKQRVPHLQTRHEQSRQELEALANT